MKRFCIYIVLILIVLGPVFSQEQEVFAPFVSRLKVVPEGPRVRITWNDSSDVDGGYIVYRYTEEINEANFRLADIAGRVPSGKEFFIDTPPEFGRQFYYAVLAESDQGELFELFIPFRNKTVYAVSVEEVSSITDMAAAVGSIQAEATEDYILLTFEADKKGRELSVYRNISPIRTAEDILDSSIIALISSSDSDYRDFSIPGIQYYYGIIDSELAKTGNYTFVIGENSTASAAAIALSADAVTAPALPSRPKPLPFLTITSALSTGEALASSPLPVTTGPPLSKEIRDMVNRIAGRGASRPPAPLEPVFLEADRLRISEGESYSLGRILTTSFQNSQWEEAETRIINFQRTRHSGDEDLRSDFYLGQTLFFQEKYHEAFYSFLAIREEYRQEADPWIDRTLMELR